MRRCRFCKKDIEDAATVCNHCGKSLIPGRTPPTIDVTGQTITPLPTATNASPTKKICPFCAEEIQAAAIVCKHCGRNLKASTPPTYPVTQKKKSSVVKWILLGFGGFVLLDFVLVLLSSSSTPTSAPRTAATATPASSTAQAPAPKAPPTTRDIQACIKARAVSITERVKKATTSEELDRLNIEVQGLEQACTNDLYAEAGLSVPENTHLQATVSFDGAKFQIANVGSVDWTNVKFDLNGGLIRSGYVHRLDELKARQEYTVGAMQFTDSDGRRFNPFQLKPQQLTITATLPTGSIGVRIVSF